MKKSSISFFTLILSIVSLVTSGVTAYLLPHLPLVWQVSGGIAIVTFLFYVFGERRFYAEVISKRTTQFGMIAFVMSVLAVGIVVAINLIGSEYNKKWDFTKNQLNSLSEQSTNVVKNLKNEVRLIAFIAPMQQPEYQKVFEKYTYHSKQLKTKYIDADREPLEAQKYNVKSYPVIIVESESRTSRVEHIMDPNDPKIEEKITNAIISVSKGDKKKIYFVTGHGEHLVTDSQAEGYSELKESLEGGRYLVQELSLLEKTTIPADAEIVIIGGPKTDLVEHEMKAIETYLQGGGKVFVMVEPQTSPKLQPFLAKFGVDWKPLKAIVETNPLVQLSGGNALTPIVNNYDANHEITRSMKAQTPSIFPIVTPVEKMEKLPEGFNVTSLFSTSRMSLVGDLKGSRLNVDQKTARKGPLSIAVAITGKLEGPPLAKPAEPKKEEPKKPEDETTKKPSGEFRMVVVGDSDFVANQVHGRNFNADLFQNMLSWLSHEEDLIAIRPKATDTSSFDITEERSRVINLASVIFAPLGLFLAGIGVWVNRRRK
jgi:ABC-type uncharacterized transport system involved in gliding motility auxiliary subunit